MKLHEHLLLGFEEDVVAVAVVSVTADVVEVGPDVVRAESSELGAVVVAVGLEMLRSVVDVAVSGIKNCERPVRLIPKVENLNATQPSDVETGY